MEQYLKDQYNVIEDKFALKNVDDINFYFSESTDSFDCGQGYYNDEVKKIVLIDNKFYRVTIKAEIGSAKQDHGERLHWVEGIKSITYVEIPKPDEIVGEYTITFTVPKYLKNSVIASLEEANIHNYKVE